MAGCATVGEQLVRRFAGVEILRGRKRRRQHDAPCGNGPKNHQRRDDLAPRSNERSQCRPLARASRLRRQQLIELRRSIGLAILIGDDDPPPFARPNLRLHHDEQPALAGKTALLIIAFCDHFIGQCASPCVALHPLSSWQRALAAIRREHGNLVPSAAALCFCTGSSRARRPIRRIINEILLAGSLPYAVRSPAAGIRPIAAATEPIMPSDPLSGRG